MAQKKVRHIIRLSGQKNSTVFAHWLTIEEVFFPNV